MIPEEKQKILAKNKKKSFVLKELSSAVAKNDLEINYLSVKDLSTVTSIGVNKNDKRVRD
ncbi:MAG: hypothetical protein ACR5KV_04770 [Wolbachia sp.]